MEKSRCPSFIGVEGIVLQETENVFKILQKNDKLKSNNVCKFYLNCASCCKRRKHF